MGANQLANIEINKLYLIICEAMYKEPIAAQDKASICIEDLVGTKNQIKQTEFCQNYQSQCRQIYSKQNR